MFKRLVYCGIAASLSLLYACQDYDFRVNDTVVYTPTLFRNFSAPDQALHTCLQQTIKDANVAQAPQLKVLDCSSAGIQNLEGLSAFTGITALRLSGNEIRNLVELNRISTLEVVYLDNNKVVDPVPLYDLPALRDLDLSGNPALQCPKPGSIDHIAKVVLPEHCR